MIDNFLQFRELFINNSIEIVNPKLDKVVRSYSFQYISKELDFENKQTLIQNLQESKVLIINKIIEDNLSEINIYYFLSFKKSLIFINQKLFNVIFLPLITHNPDSIIYFLNNFNEHINIPNKQIQIDDFSLELINNLSNKIYFNQFLKLHPLLINNIISSIAGYLIQQSLISKHSFILNPNPILNPPKENFEENDFIELQFIGFGSSFMVGLIYDIEREKLLVIKKPHESNIEHKKLIIREIDNYCSLNYYLLPKFYGTLKKKNYPIIEFINGKTLLNIEQFNFNDSDKLTIIFQIMMIVSYFHKNHFIYRDLKPNNLMIDQDKRIYFIDFDRMIKESNSLSSNTNDFSSVYIAPEIFESKINYHNDIFSLGQMIYYIMNEENPSMSFESNLKSISKFDDKIQEIYQKCTKLNYIERPSINELIRDFFTSFLTKFNMETIQNYPEVQFNFGMFYLTGEFFKKDIYKSIYYLNLAAGQNHVHAQFNLGFLYLEGKYITRDIDKATHYFLLAADQNEKDSQKSLGDIYFVKKDISKAIYYYTLAADQNDSESQFKLGNIFLKYTKVKNIEKAIYYFSLAAEQKHLKAQNTLGHIFYSNEYVDRDITKAIYYFLLAGIQNDRDAQANLGDIYFNGKYINQDIEKAIRFFGLAAHQNDSNAQFKLGLIYEKGKNIAQDIKKAIHYYSLAADQNHSKAQFNLGLIYEKGKHITQNIEKAIHYFTLAADQNDPEAQFKLGLIYETGENTAQDIKKSINYYTLAANQGHSKAQFNLGFIYSAGKYVTQDIKKAIHYYSLAANQNHSQAQFNLGLIYETEKKLRKI